MKKTQFESLMVERTAYEVYNLPQHSHNYYEIIYVEKGWGDHHINGLVLPYKKGDLFLISPDDQHYLTYKKPTTLVFIKFTDAYFKSNMHLSPDAFCNKPPEILMRNSSLKEVKLNFTEPCKSILQRTICNIVSYKCKADIAASPIVFYQILSVLGLVNEALEKDKIGFYSNSTLLEDLLSYVHENIYFPENIRTQLLAKKFGIAPNYFSNYFKREMGMTFKQYVDSYKINLIEKRLEYRESSIKQIAQDFGFTDESHFNHFFKRKKSITPKKYKDKKHKQLINN